MSALNINNLSFKYDDNLILENINLKVQENDFVAIIGPNGGGKSTLLKIIVGILKPSSGEVLIFNKDINDSFQDIGYVAQNTNYNLNFPIQVLDVVLMGKYRTKRPFIRYSQADIKRANELLELVGMSDFRYQKIGALSGGQRQRVLIARAIFDSPKLLILDEPTASIDVGGQAVIKKMLKEINKNCTILMVSHDIKAAIDCASSVVYVNKTLTHHAQNSLIFDKNILEKACLHDGHICEIEILQTLNQALLGGKQ